MLPNLLLYAGGIRYKSIVMKKMILITTAGLCLALGAMAQGAAKAVYYEIGGPGVSSFNYDMRLGKSESGAGFRVGVGGFSIGPSDDRFTAIFVPVGFNYIRSKDNRNYFELGGGITPVFFKDGSADGTGNLSSTFGHLNIGYRLQPKEGGFFLRAAINPIFNKNFFWPYYGGLSLGYKF